MLIGLIGAMVLVSLGVWQLQRLTWKEGILADMNARMVAAPVAIPAKPDPVADRYLPVTASGMLGARELHVLVSRKQIGAGYLIVTSIDVGGRKFLLDRGFVRDEARNTPRPPHPVEVTGNLHWPDDRNSSTPANNVATNTWFARDIGQMAVELGAEPILIVARSDTGDGIEPLPVDTSAIPNDHLQYAITWFSLAFVWLGMTGYQLWRIQRRTA